MNTEEIPLINLEEVEIDHDFQFVKPVNLKLMPGENWIIYGPNGSGKTCLVNTLKHSYRLKHGSITYFFGEGSNCSCYKNIRCVTFKDQYSSDMATLPYQMRWNHGTVDLNFEPLIKDFITELSNLPSIFTEKIFRTVDFVKIKDRSIRSLSSGEFRRFQILQILTKHPKVLIIDNPFIGLDKEGRNTVMSLLDTATKLLKISIVIVVSRLPENLAGFSHIILVKDHMIEKKPICSFMDNVTEHNNVFFESSKSIESKTSSKIIVQANNICINYGDTKVLENLSLVIRQGEHWAITGPNGSGKSTLLSLICADNPQSYACDITLFGRRRGSGESIWDIKKNIGFVSPEMFMSFRRNMNTLDVVATGVFDTTGVFLHPKETDYAKAEKWLDVFQISKLRNRPYLTLSSGQQRLVLLCRAFVKEPQLLILDEPFHGLDTYNVLKAKEIITDYIISKSDRTLIMVSHYEAEFPQIIDHYFQLKKTRL